MTSYYRLLNGSPVTACTYASASAIGLATASVSFSSKLKWNFMACFSLSGFRVVGLRVLEFLGFRVSGFRSLGLGWWGFRFVQV